MTVVKKATKGDLTIEPFDLVRDPAKIKSFEELVERMLQTQTEYDRETIEYQMERLRALNPAEKADYMVAFRGDTAVGYQLFSVGEYHKTANLITLYVASEDREGGVGMKIKKAALMKLKDLGVETANTVVDTTKPAQGFHKKMITLYSDAAFDVRKTGGDLTFYRLDLRRVKF